MATPADIPGIARLIQKLVQHDGAPVPDPQKLHDVLQTLIDRDSTVYILAQDDEGLVIGSMQLDFRLSTWEASPYVYIEDFFVEERHRGKGIGSAMLDLALQLSRERGCVRLDLDVQQSNPGARRFYARHSFEDQQRLMLRRAL